VIDERLGELCQDVATISTTLSMPSPVRYSGRQRPHHREESATRLDGLVAVGKEGRVAWSGLLYVWL
jgi:hypothetical protein